MKRLRLENWECFCLLDVWTLCDECISECLASNPNCTTYRKYAKLGSNLNMIGNFEVRCPEEPSDRMFPSKCRKFDKDDVPACCDWRGTVCGLGHHSAEECFLLPLYAEMMVVRIPVKGETWMHTSPVNRAFIGIWNWSTKISWRPRIQSNSHFSFGMI